MRKGFAVNLKPALKVNSDASAVLPANRCFLCAAHCDGCESLCPACLGDLLLNTHACPGCARPGSAARICAACQKHPWAHIDKARCLFQYHYPLNHLIQDLKFKQGIDLANYLGTLVAGAYVSELTAQPDCILPVPLHFSRLIARGYNQSVELARHLARKLNVPLDTVSCKRIRATAPQTNLPAKKRRSNVHKAFSVRKSIAYDHVLLVDDVITTGSTVNELARVLHLAGVRRIDVLACARAD